MAKNQSLKYPGQPITIPKLTSLDPDAKPWCPVRALRCYKRRTAVWRVNHPKHLWVCFKAPHGPASKDTVSRWIVDTIKTCYDTATGQQVTRARAHDVRGLSASSALFRGVSLEDIMSVAQWHSESSFTTFYLRDLASAANPVAVSLLTNVVRPTHV